MLDRFLGGYVTASPTAPTQTSAQGVWELEQQASAQVQNAWPLPPNVIQRSLRFNRSDSAYLSRTPSTAGSRTTWTWSGWIKRSQLGIRNMFFAAGATGQQAYIAFESDDTLQFIEWQSSVLGSRVTSAVYRDVSAWYHVVAVFDTSSGTPGNRMMLYVNGAQVTAFSSSTNPSPSLAGSINNTIPHALGREELFDTDYLAAYMTEVNFVDGQALTPSSFGETDPQTGVWIPKVYTGSYGTNGFRLRFNNNSSTTALGYDTSGNGNNWTPNNFSVTAGSGNDSMLDVPSLYGTDTGLGGEVRGNYATFNPLVTGATLANGNLDSSTASGTWGDGSGSIGMKSGKWYFEATCNSITSTQAVVGITKISFNGTGESDTYRISYQANGTVSRDGITTSTTGLTTWGVGDIIGAALDVDNGTMSFYKNGVLINTTTNAAISTTEWRFFTRQNGSGFSANFGQRPFAYTAPSGFKALCTTNLSAPSIGQTSTNQADNYFNTVLYTGTGSSLSVTGTGFQPDLVWIKSRNASSSSGVYDAVRGVQKQLITNTTGDETTQTTGLTAFGSDGFTVGALSQINASATTYVAWQWYAGGSTVTNTQGTLSTQLRANPASGFSIATFTGAAGTKTFGHGLGVAPSFIITKYRIESGLGAGPWNVYHASLGNTKALFLNSTAGEATNSSYWNNTSPTIDLVTLGSSFGSSSDTFVAYCFAAIPGFSAFGSYTGNGSTDGPFVYTGFRPRFVMLKVSSGTPLSDWIIHDVARSPYNVSDTKLSPNTTTGDVTTSAVNIDILSNGFKIRNTDGAYNTSANTYIYAAFAEYPFRLALAR